MSFSQLLFMFSFLPITLFFYYVTDGNMLLLLAANLVFYACGTPEYVVLLFCASVITTAIGIGIENSGKVKHSSASRRMLLVLGIVTNSLLLVYYKYSRFLFSVLGITLPFSTGWFMNSALTLPLGISFFTFKSISLLVDIYREKVSLEGKAIRGLAYLSFFGQIQSGPIGRFSDDGWSNGSVRFSWARFSGGLQRFAAGFIKKVIVADSIAKIADEVFALQPGNISTGFAWLGAICYSLQLLFDFSGYSEMAIGVTNMFGISSEENFRYPYMTKSISEFWRRWHISLGSWFRDYIYIPLGGSRVNSKFRLYFNLLVVWLLTGIWHGTNWTFIVWGLAYCALICVEKAMGIPGKFKGVLMTTLYRLVCLGIIVLLWVPFRSPSLGYGLGFIKAMFVPNAIALQTTRARFLIRDNWAFLTMALIMCFPVAPCVDKKLSNHAAAYAVYSVAYAVVIFVFFLWGVSFVIAGSNNPFLYANF